MVYVQVCLDWTKCHLELTILMDVFKSNSYPENFMNSRFKTFLDKKHRIQEKMITVPKKPLFLVIPYLEPLSLQTLTKLRKSLKVLSVVRNYRLCLRIKTN